MSEFRKKSSSEESDNDDSGEETAFDRIVSLRPKAVATRRIPQSFPNEEASQSNKIDELQNASSKAAGRLWSETLLMQSLEEKTGSGTIAELRDRGSETYALKPVVSRKRRRPEDIADAMWEESRDQQKVEAKDEKLSESDAIPAVFDPNAELWEGVNTGEAELPVQLNRKHQWRRYRGNQSHWKQKGHKRFRLTEEGEKPKPKKLIPAEKFVPHKLMAADYDQKKLFEAEFDPESLSEAQLVSGLVNALGEQEPDIIRKAVQFAGKSISVELFKKCQETEKRGGMLTKRGNRRRTPGGVFLQLFKEHDKVSEEHKKKLFEFGAELQQKTGKGRPKWWDKRKQKKKTQKEQEPPRIEKESLPSSSELFKLTDKEQDSAEAELILELPTEDDE